MYQIEVFQVESLRDILHIVKLETWRASVDLKEAYYSATIYQ